MDDLNPRSPKGRIRRGLETVAAKLRNNSPDNDPDLDVPLALLIPVTVISAFYCLLRLYVVVEDLIAFRSLPSDTYVTVDWSSYIPHL